MASISAPAETAQVKVIVYLTILVSAAARPYIGRSGGRYCNRSRQTPTYLRLR